MIVRCRLRNSCLLSAVLALSVLAACSGDSSTPPGWRDVPRIYLGSRLSGTPLYTYPGDIYAVDFWASWSQWCRLQLAQLDTLQSDYAGRVHVIAVSCDDNRDSLEAYLASHRYSFAITWAKGTDMMSSFGVRGFPTDFVIDRNAGILRISAGYRPGLPELSAMLDSLLAADRQQELTLAPY